MSATLRPAGPTDAEIVLEMMRGLYAHEGIVLEAGAEKALRHLLATESLGRVFLIEWENRCVGYAVLTWMFSLEYGGSSALLDELFIQPGHRGQGLGRAVLEALTQECRRAGARAIHLEVEHGNTVAQGLYEKQGFVPKARNFMTKRLKDGI